MDISILKNKLPRYSYVFLEGYPKERMDADCDYKVMEIFKAFKKTEEYSYFLTIPLTKQKRILKAIFDQQTVMMDNASTMVTYIYKEKLF